jgi:NAD(P)-dependent dehydrogenase (short-subunit alcohol dehydrogenase family)
MEGKIALVTGANGGLGATVTQALLDAGATVVGVSRKIQQSEYASPAFLALPTEISNLAAARDVVAQVLTRYGRIDAFVHLVGGFAGGATVAETDDATLQRMLDLNLMSAFHMMRAVIPPMRTARQGRIIATGSRAALDPGPGVGAYSLSKAALVSLVRTVAAENQDAGITANVILPGTMDTPANRKSDPNADFSQWVQPANIASLIVWLAGSAGRDVNGAVIPVYGPHV